jgi:lipoic acid synthetase
LVTKSNLILGLGETRSEISEVLHDLRSAGCDLITITQYLRPSLRHHPVDRWVKPEEFVELAAEAEAMGFAGVLSGPLVRSSYRAGKLYRLAVTARGDDGISLGFDGDHPTAEQLEELGELPVRMVVSVVDDGESTLD